MATLVILHGWGGLLAKWQPLAGRLKRKKISVRLLKIPADKPRNIRDFSQWLKFKTKTLAPFYLLGHSFGGQIAIDFAAHHPDRVRGLILLSSAGVRRRTLKARLLIPIAKIIKHLVPVSPLLRRRLYRIIRETDYDRATPAMKATMRQILAEDQQENMKKIINPALIIWGEKDSYTPLWQGRLTHRLIKNSRLVVVSGGRHGFPFTHGKTLISKILWFMRLN